MSDYAYVANHARRVFSAVSRMERNLFENPDSWADEMNLQSMQKLAQQAKEQLDLLAAEKHIDVCDYRIVPVHREHYALSKIPQSFFNYQQLFSQLYDSFKNGKKDKAVIGRQAALESELGFAYSYSGSLGVVLLANSERDFFDGNLDESIEALYQIMEISDSDTVRDIASARGRAVVKRIHDWSLSNYEGGFSADIKWKRSDGKLLGQVIDHEQLGQISELITDAADEKTDEIIVRGILVAVSLPAKSFHLTVPEGETYKGHFDDDFSYPSEMTVGRLYEAKIKVSDIYYYSTDLHKTTDTLLSLSGPIGDKDFID